MKKIAMLMMGVSMSSAAFAGVTVDCYETKGLKGTAEKLFSSSDITPSGELDLMEALGVFTTDGIAYPDKTYQLKISAKGMDASNVYNMSRSSGYMDQGTQVSQGQADVSGPFDQIDQDDQMGQSDQIGESDQSGDMGQTDQIDPPNVTPPTDPTSPVGPDKIKVKLMKVRGKGEVIQHDDCETVKNGKSKTLSFKYIVSEGLFKNHLVQVKCQVSYRK